MNRTNQWTPDQEQRLLEICVHTHRIGDIAALLEPIRSGMSRNAIIGKIQRLRARGHQITTGPSSRTYPDPNKPRKVRQVKPVAPVEIPPVSTLPKPRRGPPPSDPPCPELAVYSPRLLTLFELEPHHCRWPIGDQAPFLFCGAVAEPGWSYCHGHVRLARGGHGR